MQMAISMKDSGKMIKHMAMEAIPMPTEQLMSENGKTTNNMAKE